MATVRKKIHISCFGLCHKEGDDTIPFFGFILIKTNPKMTIMSLFYQNRYSALPRSSIFIISLLIPLMVHEYVLYVTFVASKIVLRHPRRDASKNVPTLTVSEFDEILRAS